MTDKIKPAEIGAELEGVVELVQNQEWQIFKDDEIFWQEHLEQSETEKKETDEIMTPRVIHNLPACEGEGQTEQQVELFAVKPVLEKGPPFD